MDKDRNALRTQIDRLLALERHHEVCRRALGAANSEVLMDRIIELKEALAAANRLIGDTAQEAKRIIDGLRAG